MDSRKLLGFAIGVLLFLATLLFGTYAFYNWKSGNTDVTFNIGDSYFYCETGQNVSETGLAPVLDYQSTTSKYTFKVNNIGKSDTKFSVTLNISEISESLKSTSLKYKLMVDKTGSSSTCDTSSNCTEAASGDFSKMKKGINTIAPSIDLPNNSRYQYYLFIYIDGNMQNDTSMQSGTLKMAIEVCDIIVTLDYNGGNVVDNKEYIKVASLYTGLPDSVSRNTSNVTYDTAGGSSVSNDSVSYTFAGWYLENTFKNKVTASTEVKSTINHTLYAKWNPSKTVTLPTTTKTGYTFAGWYNGSSYVGAAGGSYNPSTSVTLTAHWNANKYNISYSLNNGTKGSSAPTSANYGSVINITNPTKTVTITGNVNGTGATVGSATSKAQTFAGWTASNLNTSTAYYGTSSSAVSTAWSNASTKVTAQYFKNLNPTNNSTVTLTANWTAVAMTVPTISKTGYTCTWNTAADGSGTSYNSGASYTPSATGGNITLYARCSVNQYSISYNLDGGAVASSNPITYNAETSNIQLNSPIKIGYTFLGWLDSQDKIVKIDNVSMPYTMTATGGNKFSNTKIQIWTTSGSYIGQIGSTSSVGHYSGTYAFSSDTGTYKIRVGANGSTMDYTFYFYAYLEKGTTYKFEWDVVSFSDTSIVMDNLRFYRVGGNNTSVPIETIKKGSYGNKKLTAKWQANQYNISYNLNNGTKGTNAPTSANYDSVVNISNPTKTITITGNVNSTGATIGGATSATQTFAGWTANNLNTSTAYYGTSSSAVSTAWSNASTKVTAQYFKNLNPTNNSTVTLTANWTPVSLKVPTVSKTGYACTWNTAADGSGTSYNSGASYTPTVTSGNVTLYAICKINSYKLTVNPNGGVWNGTTSNSTFNQNYNTTKSIAVPTTNAYYTITYNGNGGTTPSSVKAYRPFTGWSKSGSGSITSNTPITTASQTYTFGAGDGTITAGYNSTSNGVNLATSTKTFKITYDTNNSGCSSSKSSQDANVTGTGWYTAASGGTLVGAFGASSKTFTSNSTLYAKWNSASDKQTLATITKTGYTCKWNTKSDGSGTSYSSGASSVTVGANTTLYAISTINNYYIDLNWKVDGTSYSGGDSYGTNQLKACLKIGGTDKGCVADYNSQHPYGSSWEIYKLQLGGVDVSYTSSGTLGTSNISIVPEIFSMNFSVNNSDYGAVSPTKLLVPKGYTYSASGNVISTSDGRKVTASVKNATGYTTTFSSWSNSSGTVSAATNITANFTRSMNKYNISYNLNNGTKGTNAPTSASYGSVINISKPTKTITITGNANGTGATIGNATSAAQTFTGWTASNLNTSTAYYGTSSSAVNTAWSNASTKVVAEYFKNLTSTSNATVTLTANWNPVSLKVPTISKTGNTCNWKDSSGNTYASGATYTPSAGSGNVTLNANCVPNNYVIKYNENYQKNDMNAWNFQYQSRFSITYDSSSNMNTVAVAGASGWEIVYLPIQTVDGREYTVSFDYEVPSAYTALSGYSGVGYQILKSINDTDNSANAITSGNIPTSVTSSKVNKTLTFTGTGGTVYFAFNYGMAADGVTSTLKLGNVNIYTSVTKQYGTTLGTLPSATRAGYEFLGWYTSPSAGTKISSTTNVPASNTTYYARWSVNQYTVKFYNNDNYTIGANQLIIQLSGRNYYKKYEDPCLAAYLYSTGGYTGPVLVGVTPESVTYYTDYDRSIVLAYSGTFVQDGVTYYYSNTGLWMGGDVSSTSGISGIVKYSNMDIETAAKKLVATTSSNQSQVFTYDEVKKLTANSYKKDGYTFRGWSTTLTGPSVYSDSQIVKNLTLENGGIVNLYAYWVPNDFSIDTNPVINGSVYNSGAAGFTYNVKVNGVQVATNVQDYWATVPYGGTLELIPNGVAGYNAYPFSKVVYDSSAVSGPTWNGITYYIAYDGNMASNGSTATTTCTYGVTCNLTANGFSRIDYNFEGWAINNPNAAATYSNQQAVSNLTTTNGATIMMYAKWVGVWKSYTATFNYVIDANHNFSLIGNSATYTTSCNFQVPNNSCSVPTPGLAFGSSTTSGNMVDLFNITWGNVASLSNHVTLTGNTTLTLVVYSKYANNGSVLKGGKNNAWVRKGTAVNGSLSNDQKYGYIRSGYNAYWADGDYRIGTTNHLVWVKGYGYGLRCKKVGAASSSSCNAKACDSKSCRVPSGSTNGWISLQSLKW